MKMREIRFRGKSKGTGEWLYGYLFKYGSIKPTPLCVCCTASISMKDVINIYEVDPDTVGQFTSLKDKNGKEIYEGDIIAFDGIPDHVIEVRFVRGVFAFLWNGNLDDECVTQAPTHEWAEVIGNVYDNEDLLKK